MKCDTSGRGNGSYGYRVQACNAGGCGPWSATGAVTVAILPAEPAYVSMPGEVTYPNGRWSVNWPAASAATSYTLQRTNTGANTVATVYTGPATSVTDGGASVVPGTYVYAVKACNGYGCSSWRSSSTMTVICSYGASPAIKSESVQPNIIKCGSDATALSQGGTP